MPFDRPTLSDLVARTKADLRSRLSIAGTLLRRAMADALGTAYAGAVHMLHGHIEWAAKQIFPDTSDDDNALRQAAFYGISRTPATFSTGNLVATGVDGSPIPTGTIYQLDSETTYRVTADATIASGTATVAVEAVLAGADGDQLAGVTLTLQSPITGVNSTATVDTGGLADGFDQETVDSVRARLILHLRQPPEGGADPDYEEWTLAVAGPTRVWVYPNENGLGTVVVRFVIDGRMSILPTSPEVAAVQAALDAERPITAEVTAAAPTSLAVAFTIHLDPDTAALRTAVTAELTDLLTREAAPGDGAGLGTIKLSHIRTAIGNAVGTGDYTLTVPAADVVPTTGQIPLMGTVTWS